MMKLNEMLKVEGADYHAVLVYGVVRGTDVRIPEIQNAQCWLLGEESDPFHVVLCEAHVYDEGQIPQEVIRLMQGIMTSSEASVCFAMTDGVFDGIQSFFDPECVRYVYAVAKGNVSCLNYAYDEEVRVSDIWMSVVMRLRGECVPES